MGKLGRRFISSSLRRAAAGGSAAVVVGFSGCATDPLTDIERSGPAFGRGEEESFRVATETGTLKVGDLARIGETIARYKRLGASEQEILRRLAQARFDGLVVQEINVLRPVFEGRKAAVRDETAGELDRIEAGRAQRIAEAGGPVPLTPQGRQAVAEAEAEAARAVAAARADETRRLAAIDTQWREAAVAAIVSAYGSDFAVPVKNPEGKAVVALASVREGIVTTASTAYQLDVSPAVLVAAAAGGPGNAVAHEGSDYALLDVGEVAVTSP